MSEWASLELPGISLTSEDRRLAQSLRHPGRRLAVDELRGGIRIESRSWVGKIRFSNVELRVVPKLAGENLGLVRMLDYTYGYGAMKPFRSEIELPPGGDDLFDLLALLFVQASERLLRGGLLSDYQGREEDLPFMRGRLLVDRQALRHFGRVDRLECRHDEHTADILENRILAAALELIVRRAVAAPILLRARRLQGLFSEVCSLDGFQPKEALKEITYNRLNEAYRDPHQLAELIFEGLGVKDLFSPGQARCFAFLLDMNRLFQAFVTRWLRDLLRSSAARVVAERSVGSVLWDADAGKSYARVRPDVVVQPRRGPGEGIPMDAKYKQFDLRRVPAGDLYQSFLYAFAYGAGQGRLRPTTFLLYPTSSSVAESRRILVRDLERRPGAEVLVCGLHIPTVLEGAAGRRWDIASGRIRVEVLKRLDSRWEAA